MQIIFGRNPFQKWNNHKRSTTLIKFVTSGHNDRFSVGIFLSETARFLIWFVTFAFLLVIQNKTAQSPPVNNNNTRTHLHKIMFGQRWPVFLFFLWISCFSSPISCPLLEPPTPGVELQLHAMVRLSFFLPDSSHHISFAAEWGARKKNNREKVATNIASFPLLHLPGAQMLGFVSTTWSTLSCFSPLETFASTFDESTTIRADWRNDWWEWKRSKFVLTRYQHSSQYYCSTRMGPTTTVRQLQLIALGNRAGQKNVHKICRNTGSMAGENKNHNRTEHYANRSEMHLITAVIRAIMALLLFSFSKLCKHALSGSTTPFSETHAFAGSIYNSFLSPSFLGTNNTAGIAVGWEKNAQLGRPNLTDV